ncbi:MAG TPA: HEAT repeat domain-containing protein [Gemmataceae bacterium]|nr:HEAT repeat domain-containing protein [Gemmataceae bacterium]
MLRRLLAVMLAAGLVGWSLLAPAEPPAPAQWVWFNEGDPAASAPAETRYFRTTFPLPAAADEATLEITADNGFLVWVNGKEAGGGNSWMQLYQFDVAPLLLRGKNVIAVEAHNEGGPAGLVVRLTWTARGQGSRAVVSDGSWKASKTAAAGWRKADFNEAGWSAVKVIGPLGKAGPWRNVAAPGDTTSRFTVPEGFAVENVARNPKPSDPFSLVNMTFDSRGRLLVSQENGPVLLCTDPDRKGVLQNVRPYCKQVTNCQGMCWVEDALILMGNGPQGTGLYRVRDTKGTDSTDEVTLLRAYKGGMGEHGPHAVLHGPDGFLYAVNGNHSWAMVDRLADNSPLRRWPNGQMGPDQGRPDTTEDVLLPRMSDAHGHAAGILAPGGCVWRMDTRGRHPALVAAGFRNEFDAAFSPAAELFAFDSDMEWDENLPWYRPVRVCFCPPGAEFGWRNGSSKIPPYALDTLPAVYDTGRGSPVGLEFYDHTAFPAKYRGALFMGDWSIGVIWAVMPRHHGAGYQAEVEKFCVGNPMNVTDLGVAPDGSLYFTMGGRGSQGGVYRIVYRGKGRAAAAEAKTVLDLPQPLAAWSRAKAEQLWRADDATTKRLEDAAADTKRPARERIKALTLLQMHGHPPDVGRLEVLAGDRDADVRSHAVWLLGVNGPKEARPVLLRALADEDAGVRRRACEALVRAGIEPPVEKLWPLLAEKDRFLSTAARLVLQRIPPEKWADRLWREPDDLTAYQGIIALCKTNQALPFAEPIFNRLRSAKPGTSPGPLLDYLRTVEMALIHTDRRPASVRAIAEGCQALFPHSDDFVNRELANLLTDFSREKLLPPATDRLVRALEAANGDRQQQIYYFYCLRLLRDGWSAEDRQAVRDWYEGTESWQGGFSMTPYLENIFRELLDVYPLVERRGILENAERQPLVALVLAQRLQADRPPELLPALHDLSGRLAKANAKLFRLPELRAAVAEAESKIALEHPTADNFPYLVRGLDSSNPVVLLDVIAALKKLPAKPKPEDGAAYRALLLAARRLDVKNRWQAVELLRRWSDGKQFGHDADEANQELDSWYRWYGQAFPKEPPLPSAPGTKVVESKYKYDDLLRFLTQDPAGLHGDPARGRKVFEKAQCIKCHKFGKEGEGLGPDLTTLAKRFKRADILESIYYPSKVISDQYRATVVVTTKGQEFTGLAAPMGNAVTLLLSDGSKVTLNVSDIEQRYASLVSVMPEKLLDPLTKPEIADLFALLESAP